MEHKFINIKEVFDTYKIINVPYYQRDYVWGSKNDGRNLYKFIDDIFTQYSEKPEETYFIGTIAFCSAKVNDVIDGQQRLTSIILILSILANTMCSEDIKNKNDKFIMPDGKFVIQEENYLTEELKYNLGLDNNFNSQGYNVNISKTVDRIKSQIERAWSGNTTIWYDNLYNYILDKVMIISLEYNNISDSLKYFLNINSLSIQLTQVDIFYSILSQIIRISNSTYNIFNIKQKIAELGALQGLSKDFQDYKAYDLKDKGVDNIIYIFLSAYYKDDKDIFALNETGIGKWISFYKNVVFNDQLVAKVFIDKFMSYLNDLEYVYKQFSNFDSNVDIKSSIYTSFILLKYESYSDILQALFVIFVNRHNYQDNTYNLYNNDGEAISNGKINEISKRLNLTILNNYIRSCNKRLEGYITNIEISESGKYIKTIDEIVVDMPYDSIFNLKYNDGKNKSPDSKKIKDESRIIKAIMALQEALLNNTANNKTDINEYLNNLLLTNNFTIEHIYSLKEYDDSDRLNNWISKKNKFDTANEFDIERFSFENLSLLDINTNASCGTLDIQEKFKKYKNAKSVCGSEWEYLILSLIEDSEYYRNESIKNLGIPERKLVNIDQNTWELSDRNRDFNTFLLKLAIKNIASK